MGDFNQAEGEIVARNSSKSGSEKTVTPNDVVHLWNEMAKRKNLPATRRIDNQRGGIVRSLIKKFPGLESKKNWRAYFRQIGRSPILTAPEESGWRVTLDWALSRHNMLRVMSGEFNPPPEEVTSFDEGEGSMPPTSAHMHTSTPSNMSLSH